jgi:pseudouridine-5'-phosphate glycosidase
MPARQPGNTPAKPLLPLSQGVCVVSYGTHEFPAFFSRTSGCSAPARADDPAT